MRFIVSSLAAAIVPLAAAIALIGNMSAARADLTITQKTVIQCPGMQQMLGEIPVEQRAPLLKMMSPMLTGTPWITTTYLKGTRMRTDMGQTSLVVNSASGDALTIDRVTHRYSVGPYDPFQASSGSFTCHITPTDEHATLLGQPVRRYIVAMTSSVLPHSPISGEIWAAPNLPTPPDAGFAGGAGAMFQAEMAKVQGMPLAYRLVYKDTPAGDISVTSYATSIAKTALSEEAFRAPQGYEQGRVQTASGTPSAGFPLGDGLPLDSLAPVTNEMALGQSHVATADQGPIDLNKLIAGANSGESGASGPSDSSASGLGQMLQGMAGSDSGQAPGGVSPGDLGQLLSSLSGGDMPAGMSAGDLQNLVNPQMLRQLQAELQSLLNDDGD